LKERLSTSPSLHLFIVGSNSGWPCSSAALCDEVRARFDQRWIRKLRPFDPGLSKPCQPGSQVPYAQQATISWMPPPYSPYDRSSRVVIFLNEYKVDDRPHHRSSPQASRPTSARRATLRSQAYEGYRIAYRIPHVPCDSPEPRDVLSMGL
jgi:hypothetical protein